jgi:hypothetical protein
MRMYSMGRSVIEEEVFTADDDAVEGLKCMGKVLKVQL